MFFMDFPGLIGPLIMYLSTATASSTCLLFLNIPGHIAKLGGVCTSLAENKTSRKNSDHYLISGHKEWNMSEISSLLQSPSTHPLIPLSLPFSRRAELRNQELKQQV